MCLCLYELRQVTLTEEYCGTAHNQVTAMWLHGLVAKLASISNRNIRVQRYTTLSVYSFLFFPLHYWVRNFYHGNGQPLEINGIIPPKPKNYLLNLTAVATLTCPWVILSQVFLYTKCRQNERSYSTEDLIG